MDMRFYWVQDRVKLGDFAVHWLKGEQNLADYFTKHHPPSHHIKMRPIYLHTGSLAQLSPPDCRGVLIRNSGLPESYESGSESSQSGDRSSASERGSQARETVCGSCNQPPNSSSPNEITRQARVAVCGCCNPPHILSLSDTFRLCR
jgi:hypothetical protein